MTLTSLRPWSSPMRPVPMMPTRMVMSSATPGWWGRMRLVRSGQGSGRPAPRPQVAKYCWVRIAMGSGRSKSHGYMSCSTMQNRSRSSAAEGIDDGRHVGLAERRLDHRAEAHGGREAEPLLADPGPDGRIHLLEMDVPDALGVVADESQVVRSAVGDVAGVQAQLHGLRVGAIEEALDLLLGARHGCPRGCGTRARRRAGRRGTGPARSCRW